MRIKLRETDKLFTKIVRIKYAYTCQKCGRVYPRDGSLQNLGVSHYWVRSRESTRFDLDNVTLLCNLPCHHRWEGEERDDYKKYMIERLGQVGYDLLTVRAHTYQKKDDVLMLMYLKQELKFLGDIKKLEEV